MPENYWTLKVFVGLAANFPRLRFRRTFLNPRACTPDAEVVAITCLMFGRHELFCQTSHHWASSMESIEPLMSGSSSLGS